MRRNRLGRWLGAACLFVVGTSVAPRDTSAQEAPVAPRVVEPKDVLRSLYRFHPQFESYRASLDAARFRVTSARGAWDLQLDVAGETHPLKPYHLADVTLAQPTPFWGLSLFVGWQASFETLPSYKDMYTHKFLGKKAAYKGPLDAPMPGLAHAGLMLPLLRGGPIDKERATLYKAQAKESGAKAKLDQKQLDLELKAIESFWKWVEAGKNLEVVDALLEQANSRQKLFEGQAKEGAVAPLYLIENQKTVIKRQASLIEAQQKFEQNALKLSLYLRLLEEPYSPRVVRRRDAVGDWFEVEVMTRQQAKEDAIKRVKSLPSWAVLEAELRGVEAELDLSENQILPKLDTTVSVGQPLEQGAKTDLTVKVGFSTPLQMRAARGETDALESDRLRLRMEQRWLMEQVVAEVVGLHVEVDAANQTVKLKEREVELMKALEEAEREKFELGASSLFMLNLREQNRMDAQKSLIKAKRMLIVAYSKYLVANGTSLGALYGEAKE